MSPKITDGYLPQLYFGEVESALLRQGGSMSAPLIEAEVVEAEFNLKLAASPIDHCIRNLTTGFPDNPTYFALSESLALNAVIGRFSKFQCVIVTWEFYKRASILWNSLLADEGLTDFIKDGIDPEEPSISPTKCRSEALAELLSNDVHNASTTELAVQLNYLLMYLLAAHEVGHLALGHLHRLRNLYVDEAGTVQPDLRVSSRAREWDADGFAMGAALYLTGSEFAQEALFRKLLVSKEANLRVLFVVAYALFILLDDASPQERPLDERTHPRPLVRIGLTSLAVSRLLHMFGSMNVGEVMDTARRALRSVEIAILRLAGGVMESELAEKLTSELETEVSLLSASFNEQILSLDRSRIKHYYWAEPLSQQILRFSDDDQELTQP
jgi:hypothetical protein